MRGFRGVSIISVSLVCVMSLLSFVACKNEPKVEGKAHVIQEVAFDASMGKGTAEYDEAMANPSDAERYMTLKKLYEDHLPSKMAFSETPKIPKILHQIWLGPKTPPAHFMLFRDKWKAMHPDWEYKLWTDADLDSLNLELRDLIDASPNYAEKSDILRSELLERFGGVYLDVDMDPKVALTELNHKYDFYCGIETPHKIATVTNQIWVGISIIASCPHHPIMQRWKELIRARWVSVNDMYASSIERVINHTYFPFSFAVFEKLKDENMTNMLFPATYFYPLSASNAARRRDALRSWREKLYEFLEKIHLKAPRAFSRVYPETIAVHYWGSSWQPNKSEQIKDLQAQLDFLRQDIYSMRQKMRQIEKTQTAMLGNKTGEDKLTLKAR